MATERFALTDRAIRIIAEDKIQSAIRAGAFDNLPGLGEPFDWCDEPHDPNWWVRRKLRDERFAVCCGAAIIESGIGYRSVRPKRFHVLT